MSFLLSLREMVCNFEDISCTCKILFQGEPNQFGYISMMTKLALHFKNNRISYDNHAFTHEK